MHRLVKLALIKRYAASHAQISRRANTTPHALFSRNCKL
jgi:hypothetical protein